jgi:ribonuclease VapC
VIVDTSALLAVLLREPSAERLLAAVMSGATRRVSVASILEASLVLVGRLGEQGDLELDALVRELALDIVPVTADQLRIARDAGIQFGRSRHSAGLNYGDLFSYSLAVSEGESLLFVGDDFGRPDVAVAVW